MEYKELQLDSLELKAGTGGHGRLTGYAGAFNNLDRVGDIILPGAFKKTLPSFLKTGFLTFGHNHDAVPVATFDVAREDDRGLWVEADFHSTPPAQEARVWAQERMERGKSVSLSIGYSVPKDGAAYDKGVRNLKAIDLFEASLVNIPANPLAIVAGVKDGLHDGLPYGDHLDAVLAAVREAVTRGAEIQELRKKQGRMLSSANAGKLQGMSEGLHAILEAIDALLDQALGEPEAEEPKGIHPTEILAIRQRLAKARLALIA
jgi:HK97 family phage prohead protease